MYKDARVHLKNWANLNDIDTNSYYTMAYLYLLEQLPSHPFHEEFVNSQGTYIKYAKSPLEHPIAAIDKGFYIVDCKTDVSALSTDELAKLMLQMNDHSSNAFIQQIRRRLNILERPLVTARGEGKSYIYANFNPKYAQMTVTILRTYYNFHMTFKG